MAAAGVVGCRVRAVMVVPMAMMVVRLRPLLGRHATVKSRSDAGDPVGGAGARDAARPRLAAERQRLLPRRVQLPQQRQRACLQVRPWMATSWGFTQGF